MFKFSCYDHRQKVCLVYDINFQDTDDRTENMNQRKLIDRCKLSIVLQL